MKSARLLANANRRHPACNQSMKPNAKGCWSTLFLIIHLHVYISRQLVIHRSATVDQYVCEQW
jgi:hypothetical protein